MKKKYISPIADYFDTEEDSILEGSFDTTGQDGNQPSGDNKQEHDTDQSGESGSKFQIFPDFQ